MKFFNFKNSHTNDNIIYSKKDIADMSVRDAFKNKEAIMAQHGAIGVPSESELRASQNAVYVHAYTRDDGTEVKAHWRSLPDGNPDSSTASNTIHNEVNQNQTENHSKQENSGSATGGAADIEPIVDVSTPEKVQKLMYPDEIAGVKRGEEKTLRDVAQREVNSDYNPEIENNGYNINCQSAVFAADIQARGFDIEACPGDTQMAKELAKDISFGYLNPITGNECVPDVIWLDDGITCSDYIEKNFPNNSRGILCYQTKIDIPEYNDNIAHVIMVGKDRFGNILAFDTQNNDYHEGGDAQFFLSQWINKDVVSDDVLVTVLRVDDKIPNPKYLKSVIRAHR